MKKELKTEILKNFFNEHENMISNEIYGIEKKHLIQKAFDASGVQMDEKKVAQITFPEIGFAKEEFHITHPTMDENGYSIVEPSLYYGENYNTFMLNFYESKFNFLLGDTPYEVVIVETSEEYEADEDEENEKYDGLPMFEAFIQDSETGDEVDDTITGRYCLIANVIDELEYAVHELLGNL